MATLELRKARYIWSCSSLSEQQTTQTSLGGRCFESRLLVKVRVRVRARARVRVRVRVGVGLGLGLGPGFDDDAVLVHVHAKRQGDR